VTMNPTPAIAILGGTFNPVHIGHLRLALEISEALGGIQIELVPCAVAPHKNNSNILPFALRHAMLLASVKNLPNICVNDIENKRKGPSFTYDTLVEFKNKFSETKTEIFFCMGLGDFMMLETWHKGLELPSLAQLVIIPRGTEKMADFSRTVQTFWPKSRKISPKHPFTESFKLRHGENIHALALPRLELSSSFIRSRWRSEKSLAFLIPDQALELLRKHNEIVMRHWSCD